MNGRNQHNPATMKNSPAIEKRIHDLEQTVKTLRNDLLERETNRHLLNMGQLITNRLFELGGSKVDLELIAKLNTALGIDLLGVKKKPMARPAKCTNRKR